MIATLRRLIFSYSLRIGERSEPDIAALLRCNKSSPRRKPRFPGHAPDLKRPAFGRNSGRTPVSSRLRRGQCPTSEGDVGLEPGGGAPQPFERAIEEVPEPQTGEDYLEDEGGDSEAQRLRLADTVVPAETETVEDRHEKQRLADIEGQGHPPDRRQQPQQRPG